MTTLEELITYLNIPVPAGAIMVTGKWGSGKTYLIDHNLKNAIGQEWVLAKVSLFGITDTEDLNLEVKKSVLNYRYDKLGETEEQRSSLIEKFKEGLKKIPWIKGTKELFDINPMEYIPLEALLVGKKVVLVFDDLERCRMNIVDILGCINTYCENQGFHTIIIANEERIHDTKSGEANKEDLSDANTQLLYKEIKEKIILRTLYYRPDYEIIIKNIIKEILPEITENEKKYKRFIQENEGRISSLFIKSEDIYMNNMRCIKCALQDFSRVYEILDDKGLAHIENWLEQFFLFEAAVRNGIIHSKEGGQAVDEFRELSNDKFNDDYFIHGVADWIIRGVWDSDEIEKEIKHIKEIQNLDNSFDKMRLGSVLLLDDQDIEFGLRQLMEKACRGEISLDDYLNLIRNSALLRSTLNNRIAVVNEPLLDGLKICFKRIVSGEMKDDCRISCSELDSIKYMLDPFEKSVLVSIEYFRNDNWQEKLEKEKEYLNAISKGIAYLKNNYSGISLNIITKELVDLTFDKFKYSNNKEKNGFSSIFRQIFEHLSPTESNAEQLRVLSNKLKNLQKHYESEKMHVALFHTNELLYVVEDLKARSSITSLEHHNLII